MKTTAVIQLYEDCILPTYRQAPVCLVRGRGSRVWDIEGKEYLDFFPGWAVSGLGHCHPDVVSAIKDQARRMLHISNNYLNLKQARLAQEIVRHSFPGRVFFCNSGAEAAEAAIKFAHKYGAKQNRYEIITLFGSFHGRTLGALSATGQTKYQDGFAPLVNGFRHAPFNDLDAVKRLAGEKTIAIMLELIQGEGGIQVATKEFAQGVRQLCDERGLLLIVDEVQTGMGRTGKMFAFQHYGFEPDLMMLAKTLGNGVPIGALVVHKRIKEEVLTPGSHASTYGGNPLVCAASLAVFKAVRKERLLENAQKMGNYLREKLEEFRKAYSFVKEIRGIGLMLGMQLSCPGAAIVDRCRERGLLINCAQESVLRIMPAVTITKKLIEKGIGILGSVLSEVAP